MEQMPKPPFERTLFVCCNEKDDGKASCAPAGGSELRDQLKQIVKDKGLKGRVRIVRSMCLDFCNIGPNICVMPENVWYNHVSRGDLPALVEKWIEPLEQSSS